MEDQNSLDASISPYQVFINHRGPDVKETLASHIYQWLSDKGLKVFFDKKAFKPAQNIQHTIDEAIRTSLVHIAIFSSKYAASNWCLEELCLMQKYRDAKFIPVFYDVSPGDLMLLQKGEGKCADAFKELENKVDANQKKRYDEKQLQAWKAALRKVPTSSGLELNSKIFNGDEGKLVHRLVGSVMKHFWVARTKPNDGLNFTIAGFESFLSEPRKECENVRTVGIVGTAGSGKTTLAEEYYYRQRRYFDRFSLLFGVRNASERNGLQTLQSQLLEDLTDDTVKINNISHGKQILEEQVECLTRQKQLKFLIVIDDVNNRDQLEALLLKESLLGPNSRVIVTSRDAAILKLSGIFLHYKIKPLCMDDAKKVFYREAFPQAKPIPGFEGLVDTALSKCGGLPFFLKVIGAHLHLYGNDTKENWERELEMISDIDDILKVSYPALGEEEKQIFLDIACFFEGMEKNSAIRIWDGLGWRVARTIQKLEYGCLVEIDEKNQLKMNEYHLNLGREIANQQLWDCPDLPCRLRRPDEVKNFLDGLQPVPEELKIRGIRKGTSMNYRLFGRKRLKTCSFSSVKIELLDVKGNLPDDIFGDPLRDLVWFRWKNCPRASIPLLEMNKLRVLELESGNFTQLELPTELREVRVIECEELENIQIEPLKNLERLELMKCSALNLLAGRFGELTNLQHIDFSDCQNLSELPESFGQLSQLKYLNLRNCRELTIQSELFGNITSLEQLSFQNCEKLQLLPTQTTCQRFLRELNLLGTNMEELPDNIGELINLEILYIGSPHLKKIPDSLGNVDCLSQLVLLNCTKLINYPEFPHLRCSHDGHLQQNGDHKKIFLYEKKCR